jgi:hypothetical protein
MIAREKKTGNLLGKRVLEILNEPVKKKQIKSIFSLEAKKKSESVFDKKKLVG